MADLGDIALGGAAYPIVPGSYQREPAHGRAAAVQRLGVGELTAGVGFPRGSRGGFLSTAIGPNVSAAGVEPWPYSTVFADTTLAADGRAPSQGAALVSCVVAGRAYIAIGQHLYALRAAGQATWGPATHLIDCGQTITALIPLMGNIVVGRQPWYDGLLYKPSNGALSTWRGGERVNIGAAYNGHLFYAPSIPAVAGTPGNQESLRIGLWTHTALATTGNRYAEGVIRHVLPHAGKLAVITDRAVQLIGGRAYYGTASDPNPDWRGEFEDGTSHGTTATYFDLTFAHSFKGKLYTWLGNRVVSWDGRRADAGWIMDGPSGVACYGACVAAGWLIVSVINRANEGELWATDGLGAWFRIGHHASDQIRLWPTNAGGTGQVDFLTWFNGAPQCELYRVNARYWPSGTLAATSAWISPLLDGDDPTLSKAWRFVAATFADPAGYAWGATPPTVSLHYSLDAGATWTLAEADAPAAPTRALRLSAALPPDTIGAHLQLRVTWENVVDWAPVLVGVSADYLPLYPASTRRRWTLAVRCSDQAVDRDGRRLSRTGRELAADLWAARDAGDTVTLRDVDDPDGLNEYAVRIVGIREKAAKASDQARWGETTVELELVEA
ncbi:MAG TPA: hypothetical protein PKE32_05685 [Miltoncostaeaceae bacterium]|nr:hypothetical protein [Miltoncostaeaceae bacterium]